MGSKSVGGTVGLVAGALFPTIDQATASTQLVLPSIADFVRATATASPEELLVEMTDNLFRDAVQTYEYRFAPMGMETARAGGRIIMPSFLHHRLSRDKATAAGCCTLSPRGCARRCDSCVLRLAPSGRLEAQLL